MRRGTGTQRAIDRQLDDEPLTFERPAELVDISERLYRQVFAVGLWVAAALSAFATVASLLQPTAESQLRGLAVCGVITAACVAAALRPEALYARLRHQPWWLGMAGVGLGGGAWFVGQHNFELFLPIIAVIGVVGITTSWRMVAISGLVAAFGLAEPQLIDGKGDIGGPLVVIVPPLLFWLIVDRIASFALRLHHSLAATDTAVGATSAGSGQPEPGAAPAAAPAPSEPLGLPAPRVIEVDGVKLTARQLQVVMLACEGLKHAEIGACLGIGAPLVRRHLIKAQSRTGCDTTPQLVAWAHRSGLLPGPR